jgi:hypothetical protein
MENDGPKKRTDTQCTTTKFTAKKNLQQDAQNHMNTTAEMATTSFEQKDTRLAYHHLKNWYKMRQTKPSNPTDVEMEAICNEYLELYLSQQPLITPIQTYVQYAIPDKVPQEDKVVQALKKVQLHKAPGASGLTVEQIRIWHHQARVVKDKCDRAIEIWTKILQLITIAFTTGQVPTAFYTGIMVAIPKSQQQGYCGKTLLERLHDSIHGFRTQRGTGTAIMHVKLLMQRTKGLMPNAHDFSRFKKSI